MGNLNSAEDNAPKVGAMRRLREDMKMYRLVDLHGGGELIPWMRYADRSGDHSIIDSYLEVKVSEFMYNQGKGKLVAVTELVKLRNKERNAVLGAFLRKKGKGKSGPNILDDFQQEGENAGDLKKALKLLDGGGKRGKSESKYREICWTIEDRGLQSIRDRRAKCLPVGVSMGETLVGVCLMHGTELHNRLVIKLLDAFPKLINDISISEDYYGLSPLHQAIVNQDVRMVAILLRRGADVHQRCYGAFFCADDQKASRSDSLEHEFVELSANTNYTGHMYFGEFPLSFAACMNHPDCLRLLIAHKANPNAQDTNGNTVLHMCVIHGKLEIFRLAVEKGANLRIMNAQRLTPLTLAAKLAKKQMFLEILSLEADTVWEYGAARQTAFPLARIDSINEEDGEMNEESALSLVVYGETRQHLDLMDGLLEELLDSKWDTYVRKSWLKSFVLFCFYYIFFVLAYMTRPFSLTTEHLTAGFIGMEGFRSANHTPFTFYGNTTQCHLIAYSTLPFLHGYFRLGCELIVLLLVIIQMIFDSLELRRIGRVKWLSIYKAFPAKLSYKLSFVFVLSLVPTRLLCNLTEQMLVADNVLSTLSVLLTTVHFLFYCRAIKFVGPFVLMVYTIVATDILRFLLIYSIFLVGFSQSFYVIFTSCERKARTESDSLFENIMQTPIDALLRTFIMTIGEFMNLYRQLQSCPVQLIQAIGKALFLIFELCVSILQFNLLIAMMTRTYEAIFFTRKEWKRQWAQVILMLELSVSPRERRAHLLSYSRPTGTNKKARSFVVSKKMQGEQLEERDRERKTLQLQEEKRILARKKRLDEVWEKIARN